MQMVEMNSFEDKLEILKNKNKIRHLTELIVLNLSYC